MATSHQPPPEPKPEEITMMDSIAKDRPTIDVAVKSFMCLACAQSMTASSTDKQRKPGTFAMGITNPDCDTAATQQQVLQVARAVLQSINSHTFPIHKTVAISQAEKPGTTSEQRRNLLELSSVAQLWNGLVQSNQKPSRLLGRRALKLAWMDMNMDVKAKLPKELEEDVQAKQLEWLEDFEKLLFHVPDDASNEDNDAALIWDADGGKSEIDKRKKRRNAAAIKRSPITPS